MMHHKYISLEIRLLYIFVFFWSHFLCSLPLSRILWIVLSRICRRTWHFPFKKSYAGDWVDNTITLSMLFCHYFERLYGDAQMYVQEDVTFCTWKVKVTFEKENPAIHRPESVHQVLTKHCGLICGLWTNEWHVLRRMYRRMWETMV